MAAILDFRLERFKLLLIYKSPRCFLPSLESFGIWGYQKKRKIDFQDGHLGFMISTILAIFDVIHVTPMLPSKFGVNWPFGSGKEAKIDFQDGCHGSLGFPIGTILAIFDLRYPNASYHVWSQLVFGFRRRSEK